MRQKVAIRRSDTQTWGNWL